MIKLTDAEKQIIRCCKGHDEYKYPFTGSWVNNLKPLFFEIYGWNPDEDNNYNDYLNCMFNKLLDIHSKIIDDNSGNNIQIKGVFNAAFSKSISRDDELPIERAISELCGLIQCNQVTVNSVDRYNLF
jgi:hypothetical protein